MGDNFMVAKILATINISSKVCYIGYYIKHFGLFYKTSLDPTKKIHNKILKFRCRLFKFHLWALAPNISIFLPSFRDQPPEFSSPL